MGPAPAIAIVFVSVLVAGLITETVFEEKLATYTLDPSGVKATPCGDMPTVIF